MHPPGAWALRPEAASRVPNLVFAADYVRTGTDLASMEGACEAGRRAANAILDRTESAGTRARIWPLVEPTQFDRAKRLDAWLYRNGRRHAFELLGIRNAARAAAWLRRLEVGLGLARIDDWLDADFRFTRAVRGILELLGLGGSP